MSLALSITCKDAQLPSKILHSLFLFQSRFSYLYKI